MSDLKDYFSGLNTLQLYLVTAVSPGSERPLQHNGAGVASSADGAARERKELEWRTASGLTFLCRRPRKENDEDLQECKPETPLYMYTVLILPYMWSCHLLCMRVLKGIQLSVVHPFIRGRRVAVDEGFYNRVMLVEILHILY